VVSQWFLATAAVKLAWMNGWLGFNGIFNHASSGYIMPEVVKVY